VIRLGEGIGVDDIEFLSKYHSSYYMDLVIRIKSTGETLTVLNGLSNYYASQGNYYSIQAIEFADGTVWWHDDIVKQSMSMNGTDLYGYADKSGGILTGNTLNNTLYGSAYNDSLSNRRGFRSNGWATS
jgi:hypothetical protein